MNSSWSPGKFRNPLPQDFMGDGHQLQLFPLSFTMTPEKNKNKLIGITTAGFPGRFW